MDTILQPPEWPLELSNFVTWCLMWDPKNRPTSKQALDHELFADAVDPLRPKSSASRLLGRKHSDLSFKSSREWNESPGLSSKTSSWFRRSLIARESAPAVPQQDPNAEHLGITLNVECDTPVTSKIRSKVSKRASWANALGGAPMPILPSIRPVSPLSNSVNAQASSRIVQNSEMRTKAAPVVTDEKSKKVGRQLSLNSHGNHYADIHRLDAERALNGNGGLLSPSNGQKESFFSHLRKRARRFSGRHGVTSPNGEDIEASAGAAPWSNRSSIAVDNGTAEAGSKENFTDLDKALQSVRYSLEKPRQSIIAIQPSRESIGSPDALKRHHSLSKGQAGRSTESIAQPTAPISSRTRRALQMSTHPMNRYETPEEEDELLDEVLASTNRAAKRLDQYSKADAQRQRAALLQKDNNVQPMSYISSNTALSDSYPTPAPSAKRNGVRFGDNLETPTRPLDIITHPCSGEQFNQQWPTPPYDENEWAAAAAASIFAAGSTWR